MAAEKTELKTNDTAKEKPKQTDVKEDGKVEKRSWRPASLLDVPARFKNPNFEYRWITDSMPGNILKKQYEGWELDTVIAPKMKKAGFFPPTMHDGQQKDNFQQSVVPNYPYLGLKIHVHHQSFSPIQF